MMKYLYLLIIVVIAAVVLLFTLQNLQLVTLSLFSSRIVLPMSITIIMVYIAGMLTGAFLLELLKKLCHKAKGKENHMHSQD